MMRTGICIFFLLYSALAQAQAPNGRDTSFTNQGALIETRKKYPGISLAPEIKNGKIQEIKNIVYCTLDTGKGKRDLLLDAFYPSDKKKQKRTAILIIHGGGWRSGDRSQHYNLAQRLALLGYVCFTAEYRLSPEAKYPAAIYDIKGAVRWIRQHAEDYGIDSSRITALGFSAGGELAAFAGNTNDNPEFEPGCAGSGSTVINAIIDIDGTLSFVHPESGEGDDSKKISAATAWFGVSKKDNPALWEKASPLYHAGPNSVPTLFINSSVKRMHAGRTDYISILDKHNIYTEVHEFPDSPHAFVLFHPWIDPTIEMIDRFLGKIFQSKKSDE